MTSDARRAHLRVGAVTVTVFLLFLLVAAAHGGANASSSVEKANQTAPEQSAPVAPDSGGGSPAPGTGGDSSL